MIDVHARVTNFSCSTQICLTYFTFSNILSSLAYALCNDWVVQYLLRIVLKLWFQIALLRRRREEGRSLNCNVKTQNCSFYFADSRHSTRWSECYQELHKIAQWLKITPVQKVHVKSTGRTRTRQLWCTRLGSMAGGNAVPTSWSC